MGMTWFGGIAAKARAASAFTSRAWHMVWLETLPLLLNGVSLSWCHEGTGTQTIRYYIALRQSRFILALGFAACTATIPVPSERSPRRRCIEPRAQLRQHHWPPPPLPHCTQQEPTGPGKGPMTMETTATLWHLMTSDDKGVTWTEPEPEPERFVDTPGVYKDPKNMGFITERPSVIRITAWCRSSSRMRMTMPMTAAHILPTPHQRYLLDGLQPADFASRSEQNHRSPDAESIFVAA